jgi:hypothetical protein
MSLFGFGREIWSTVVFLFEGFNDILELIKVPIMRLRLKQVGPYFLIADNPQCASQLRKRMVWVLHKDLEGLPKRRSSTY